MPFFFMTNMKSWSLILLAMLSLMGTPQLVKADVGGLVKCKDSTVYQKRLDGSIKKLKERLSNYEEATPAYLALKKEIVQTEVRFDKYSKQGLLCGSEGLPHLIAGPNAHGASHSHPGAVISPHCSAQVNCAPHKQGSTPWWCAWAIW